MIIIITSRAVLPLPECAYSYPLPKQHSLARRGDACARHAHMLNSLARGSCVKSFHSVSYERNQNQMSFRGGEKTSCSDVSEAVEHLFPSPAIIRHAFEFTTLCDSFRFLEALATLRYHNRELVIHDDLDHICICIIYIYICMYISLYIYIYIYI